MSKISVIVPLYNVEDCLKQCIESILNQSFKDFYLILVNDGSNDKSGAICDEYSLKDKRIKVIHKKNGGVSSARNVGIEYALTLDADWIVFVDSDDWITRIYLETLYNMVNDKVLIASCGVQFSDFKDVENLSANLNFLSPEKYWLIYPTMAAVLWNKIFHKKLFNGIKFPEGLINEDEFTTYKILFSVKKIAYNPSKLYCYVFRKNSIMHKAWSPNRLVINDARLNQLEFFKNNHYKKAYRWSIYKCAEVLCSTINDVIIYGKELDLIDEIRNKLVNHLNCYKKYFPIDKYKDYYLLAYPDKEVEINRLYSKKNKKK